MCARVCVCAKHVTVNMHNHTSYSKQCIFGTGKCMKPVETMFVHAQCHVTSLLLKFKFRDILGISVGIGLSYLQIT